MGDVVSVVEYLREVADRADQVKNEPRMLTLRQLNARYAKAALAIHRGNQTAAAEAIGITRQTLMKLVSEADR